MKTFKVSYSYKNSVCPSLSLWMVIPSGAKATGMQPEQVTLLPTGEELGYFVLEEGTELEVIYEQGEYTPDQQVLSDEERLFYLRDTTLSSINEVKEKTQKLTGHLTDPKEIARVIFIHIVKEFRYIYPPAERGVASFLQRKRATGEFFLFLEGTVYLKRASFFIGLMGVLLSFLIGNALFDLLYTGAFAVYALSCLVRKERVMVFGLVFILMMLSFMAALGKAGVG